jgi:hypothetical protein
VTVATARDEIAKRATGSPREHPARYLPSAYRQARVLAMLALNRLPGDLPDSCLWTIAQVLDLAFFPEPWERRTAC